MTVTTDQLAVVIPEFVTKYGAGKAVGISGMLVKAPIVTGFTSEGQTIKGDIRVTIMVESEVALIAEFNDFAGKGNIYSQAGSIFGNLGLASAGSIGANFTTTLGLTSDQVLAELQTLIDTEIVVVNQLLAAGIAVPSIMGIDLSDFELDFFKGYLEFGMSV